MPTTVWSFFWMNPTYGKNNFDKQYRKTGYKSNGDKCNQCFVGLPNTLKTFSLPSNDRRGRTLYLQFVAARVRYCQALWEDNTWVKSRMVKVYLIDIYIVLIFLVCGSLSLSTKNVIVYKSSIAQRVHKLHDIYINVYKNTQVRSYWRLTFNNLIRIYD